MITIEAVGSHVYIEIQTHTSFCGQYGQRHGSLALAPEDDHEEDVAQHGGHTLADTKSCSLGLQRISLISNINVMINPHMSN